MITTSTKRKIIITKLEVDKLERFRPFEIKLPANVVKVVGILVTAFGGLGSGTVSFQANGFTDIFHVARIVRNDIESSDEELSGVEDSQFDSRKAWVTGKVPSMRSVSIDGDTTIINGWLKVESFDNPFSLRVYLECELAEQLEAVRPVVTANSRREAEKVKDIFDPVEVHL